MDTTDKFYCVFHPPHGENPRLVTLFSNGPAVLFSAEQVCSYMREEHGVEVAAKYEVIEDAFSHWVDDPYDFLLIKKENMDHHYGPIMSIDPSSMN